MKKYIVSTNLCSTYRCDDEYFKRIGIVSENELPSLIESILEEGYVMIGFDKDTKEITFELEIIFNTGCLDHEHDHQYVYIEPYRTVEEMPFTQILDLISSKPDDRDCQYVGPGLYEVNEEKEE